MKNAAPQGYPERGVGATVCLSLPTFAGAATAPAKVSVKVRAADLVGLLAQESRDVVGLHPVLLQRTHGFRRRLATPYRRRLQAVERRRLCNARMHRIRHRRRTAHR